MKRVFLIGILIAVAGCSIGKTDAVFDVHTEVRRHSYDDSKGIQIVVFPIDRPSDKGDK